MSERFVMVTTQWRGVFAGQLEGESTGEQVVLRNARMAIFWGTERGVHQLAHTGPTSKSRISDPAPRIELRGITAVFDVTQAAEAAWNAK